MRPQTLPSACKARKVTKVRGWLTDPQAAAGWARYTAALICSGLHPEAKQIYCTQALCDGLEEELDRELLICDIDVRLFLQPLQYLMIVCHRNLSIRFDIHWHKISWSYFWIYWKITVLLVCPGLAYLRVFNPRWKFHLEHVLKWRSLTRLK